MIFLLILKIIGIIILICLGLFIFLLLTVLFIPICYEITFKSDEDNISAHVKGHWLFNILGFSGEYTKEKYNLAYRILFRKHSIIDSDADDESLPDSDENNEKDDRTIAPDTVNQDGFNQDAVNIKPVNSDNVNHDKADRDSITTDNINQYTDNLDTANTKTINDSKIKGINFKSRITKLKKKYHTFKEFLNKLRLIFDKAKTFFSNEENKAGLNHLKKEIIKFIKIVFPGKIEASLDYSTGSPDTTALALGVISVFPIGYKNKWRVIPDFETENFYIHGYIHAKGRIFVFRLIGISIRILFDKNCQKLYSYIKN